MLVLMQFWYLVNIILVMYIIKEVKCTVDCFWHGTVLENMHLEGQVFYRLSLPSVYDCAAKCVMSSACKAFNFDLEDRTCELNKNNSNEAVLISRHGSLYSDIQHWPQSVTGACSTKHCEDGCVCDADRQGQASCSKAFSGCDLPPAFPHTDVTYNGIFLNAEAVYKCVNDFRPCGQSADTWQLTCTGSGRWEGVVRTCERYRWNNPKAPKISFSLNISWNEQFGYRCMPEPVPFSERIPCGPADKINVTWTGTPLKKTHFQTVFLNSTDLLFYIDHRFNRLGDVNVLVVNTKRDRNWQDQILVHDFPYDVNRMSRQEVTLLQGNYKVSVDGRYVLNFTERWPASPDKFAISGKIKVHSVQIIVW